jgi:hypothetical protein
MSNVKNYTDRIRIRSHEALFESKPEMSHIQNPLEGGQL